MSAHQGPDQLSAELRSDAAAERLLEESWDTRSRGVSRRELATELAAGSLFLATAAALLLISGGGGRFHPAIAATLVVLYAAVSRVEFPVGAGYVVPTQLVLVPMLVLLPPATVPLLVAAALVVTRLADWIRNRASALRLLFSIADAWHAIGPACVLVAAGAPRLDLDNLQLLAVALAASCVFDAGSALLREAAARGIAPQLQLKVLALVWVVDACLAPVGFLAAYAASQSTAAVVMVVPLAGLLMLLARDHHDRIATAQSRLQLAIHERSRLQSAVRRMGDAFAAKLDLEALLDIVLRGSIEALDADAGRLDVDGSRIRSVPEDAAGDVRAALLSATASAAMSGVTDQQETDAGWTIALPISVEGHAGSRGAIAIARRARHFQEDEVALLAELVAKGQSAAADIVRHHALRVQAMSDPLTGLGNRRKLDKDVTALLADGRPIRPHLLMLFDLDGFKAYNDTFGHLAGDALLAHVGTKLTAATRPHGSAYRLGGDEFCAVVAVRAEELDDLLTSTAQALTERGEEFSVSASYGVVLLPHEADTLEQALQLADERMYSHKNGRSSAREQAHDVLMRTMHIKEPTLREHSSMVAELAVAVARRLGLFGEAIDEIARAAELHDIGKVGIPDAVLTAPRALDEIEWELMRQHTVLGERILNAAPALRPVARIVRASHERWDGAGYPDGLAGEDIPKGARIVAVCDAYEAMTSDRPYRRPMTHDQACAELRAVAGRQFDPEIVDAFLAEFHSPGGATRGPAIAPTQALAERVRTLLDQGAEA